MKRRTIVLLALAVPTLGLGWWLGSPLFLDRTVDEALSASEASAVVALSGTFEDQDDLHRGSGTASILRLEDGSHILRFEGFEVTNGPDLRVLVTSDPNPESRDDLDRAGYIEIAKLKGNIGSQSYSLPATVDVGSLGSVIIYCSPFHVIFSVARLEVGQR